MKSQKIIAAALAAAIAATAATAFAKYSETFTPDGDGALAFSVTPGAAKSFQLVTQVQGAKPRRVVVELAASQFTGGAPRGAQRDDHRYISYEERVNNIKRKKMDRMPKFDLYEDCVMYFLARDQKWFNLNYYLLPYFDYSKGLYEHASVTNFMPVWKSVYPLADKRTYRIEFRYSPMRGLVEAYLDGNYCGRAVDPGRLEQVTVSGADGVTAAKVKPRTPANPVVYELPALKPQRASALMKGKAAIAIESKYLPKGKGAGGYAAVSGRTVIAGVPMDVWAPADSIDQGAHRRTTNRRSLCYDIVADRNPWKTGPEYFQWRTPNRFWSSAYILFADIPQKDRHPIMGTQLLRFGNASSADIAFDRVSLDVAKTNGQLRTVGVLVYVDGGKKVKTPLYLLRHKLDAAKIASILNRGDSLDFEFVGGGTWDGAKRSSLQIFGCSLVEAPVGVKIDASVHGNIFASTDTPESGVIVTANRDGASGRIDYDIYDPYGKSLRRGSQKFALGKQGEKKRLSFDLRMPEVGWYGLEYRFFDDRGNEFLNHDAAFTILAPDDREAGPESPFAFWAYTGYHNTNTNKREVAEMLFKAGHRTSWQPPTTNEAQWAEFKFGLASAGQEFCNPPNYKFQTPTREKFDAYLDKAVASIRRQFEAFPHCRYIQLLHEQGGKTICPEVTFEGEEAGKAVRGKYRGWEFNYDKTDPTRYVRWEVFYCTEFCKRMKKEFPDKKIFIGNGSSSCEKIASLVRNGFDLSLVDELGIESKGFSTMPELNANQESPGMLWALRETGRVFGYTHLGLNACNEYVFRPERKVKRSWSRRQIMEPTDFTLRDYLISLAHGCGIISTGHLEDCNDSYYETNWGAGGECTVFPYSYPKRRYTAIAVLTRVFDKAVYSRRLPTGETCAYALEFRRNRRVKDYAYAFWTPRYGSTLAVSFPAGASVKCVDTFGVEKPLAPDGSGRVSIKIGSSPVYLVSSKPAVRGTVTSHDIERPPATAKILCTPTAENCRVSESTKILDPNPWGVPLPRNGKFTMKTVSDGEIKSKAVEFHLEKNGYVPPVIWEGQQVFFNFADKNAGVFDIDKVKKIGVWVRGNGSFAKVKVTIQNYPRHYGYNIDLSLGHRGYVMHDGWQYMEGTIHRGTAYNLKNAKLLRVVGIQVGSARKALDPIEMSDVEGDIAIGPIFVIPKDAREIEDDAAARAREAMKTVGEKDL